MMKLSERLDQTMQFVEAYVHDHQYAPSVSEMAREFGITIRAVYYRMYKLQELGYLDFFGSRQIRLLWKR